MGCSSYGFYGDYTGVEAPLRADASVFRVQGLGFTVEGFVCCSWKRKSQLLLGLGLLRA